MSLTLLCKNWSWAIDEIASKNRIVIFLQTIKFNELGFDAA